MLRSLFAAAAASIFMFTALSGAAVAQQHTAAVIATMDSQQILRDSKAGQSVAKQIKEYADTFQGVLKREDEALKQRQQELRKQSAILAPDVLEQRRLELQKSFTDAQRMIQDRRLGIDKTRQEALEVIKAQILTIIEQLQKERQFNLVLDRSNYSWGVPELDITQDIVDRLDKRLPSVKVARPKGF